MAWGSGSRGWSTGGSRQWRAIRQRVLYRDRYRCTIGGPECAGTAIEVDHIVNKAAGGTDDLTNLRSVCSECHRVLTQAQAQAGRRRSRLRPTESHPGLL